MSITSSLNNAMSGLNAVARAADVVSSNVANALTEGFARRELQLTSQSLGGDGAGVRVVGISRSVNQAVLTDKRLADAQAGNANTRTAFLARLEARIGTPDVRNSLSAQFVQFEAALVQASSRPDSESRLASAVTAAKNVASTMKAVSNDIQQARMEADRSIATQVNSLNDSLTKIDELNALVLAARSSGRDATALMDQRQQLVDRVAQIVPIREVARDKDQISIYTTGGAILLEGNPVVIGFSPVGIITPDMTQASGALSGLTINGRPVLSTDSGVLGGGTLGAAFAVRDELAVSAQTQLDAMARDLISRFESPAVDPSLAPGAPGLFTDNGVALNTADEIGLAGRLSVNALVDPARGGALWRIRDGIGAVAPGPVGNATLLNAMTDALTTSSVPASGTFIGAARTTAGLAADFLSQIAGARQSAEDNQSFAVARQEALTALQLGDGVDTDQEMQMLLVIEQAYAANARVIKTIDEMIQQLIGL